MGDIKEACLGTDIKMLRDDASGVVNRHFVTCERNHLGAELKVQVAKRSLFHLMRVGDISFGRFLEPNVVYRHL